MSFTYLIFKAKFNFLIILLQMGAYPTEPRNECKHESYQSELLRVRHATVIYFLSNHKALSQSLAHCQAIQSEF